MTVPESWSVTAQNLPEHARNPIHTDVGAQAAGFPAALVAGVTTYAYLCHPVVAAWGLEWVRVGAAEVRFRAPVFAGRTVTCVPVMEGEAMQVNAAVADAAGPRALLTAWPSSPWPLPTRHGEALPTYEIPLDAEYGPRYARQAGDDLDLFEREGVVHPAVWPALANHVVHRELARGSWIHVRSRIAHVGLAPAGATAVVESMVVDRFVRSGERAVLDVRISVDGALVAVLEHEAIVDVTVR